MADNNMHDNNWLWMNAADLGRGIGAGEIDPVALTETYLAAIAAHAQTDVIYARLTTERALTEANAAATRAKAGQRRGPLDGVPVSWKDLYDTAGVGTEAGTALMVGRVPTADAHILQEAQRNGLICLGKTHMSEIAFSGLGYNPMTATAPCIHDLGAVAGGSSSGAAASVGFGLAAAAIGSDTGGSIRIPAVWNNLVGFKPTHGALRMDGVVPLCAAFDTAGPLCRSVEDAGLLYTALGGPATDLRGASLVGKRFAVLGTMVGEGLDPAQAGALAGALERLQAAGAVVEHIELPFVAEAYGLAGPLYTAEAWAYWRSYIEPDPSKMFGMILGRVAAGADVLAHDYINGWKALDALRARYAAATAGYDAVLCASAPIGPPQAARLATDTDYYVEVNLQALRNTRLANLMGLCSVTLPFGGPSCGIMLNAAAGADGKLLRMAAAAEAALA